MTEAREREWQRGEYTISTDNNRLDIGIIHDFISKQSYWAQGRPIETVQRALDNSLNFGLYKNDQQIGFARVVTDYATFCASGTPRSGPLQMANGSDSVASGIARLSPLGFGNQRRTQFVCALRLHRAASARALDGASRPEYAGESRLLEE